MSVAISYGSCFICDAPGVTMIRDSIETTQRGDKTDSWTTGELRFLCAEHEDDRSREFPIGRMWTPPEWGTIYEPTVILRPENLKMDRSARIDAFCKLECGAGITIGALVHLASYVHIIGGGSAVIEDGCTMSSGAKLVTGSNVPGYSHGCSAIGLGSVIEHGLVIMRRNSTLFTNAVVLPGCEIGEGAVIAAGAVVLANTKVPAHEIWGGVPAKRIGVITRGDDLQ